MKRNLFILLLCAAFIALYNYYTTEDHPKRIVKQEQSPPLVNTQKLVDSIDGYYYSELSRLETENNGLRTMISNDNYSLKESKQKVSFLQQKVQLLSQQYELALDTSEKIRFCDSLKEKVTVLISESTVRDSLCDKTVSNLNLLTEKQDSSLAVCKNSYVLIKQNLDVSLLQQEQLIGKLNFAEQKLKHKTVLNRWLAGGLAIATGILTTKILLN